MFVSYSFQIPVADGDKGYGGFATLDVQSVNLIKYPKFKEVKWQYANMTPGDCLFLPYSKSHLCVINPKNFQRQGQLLQVRF